MNHCTACFKPLEDAALFCTHCGAAQNPAGPAAVSPAMTPAHSQANNRQTHLFSITDTTFQVRWTYWVWLGVGLSSNFVGTKGFIVGCAVVPYLIVSTLITRKQWQHQQLLDAMKANQHAAPAAPSQPNASSPLPPAH